MILIISLCCELICNQKLYVYYWLLKRIAKGAWQRDFIVLLSTTCLEDWRMCMELLFCNEGLTWIQFVVATPGLKGWWVNTQKKYKGMVISVVGQHLWSCLSGSHIMGSFVPHSALRACYPLNGGSLIGLPSVCIFSIAPSGPCHLTAISTENISMDFPAETGFKRHVSEMFGIERDLFIICMSCAIHFKHTVRSFRSFSSAEWGWHHHHHSPSFQPWHFDPVKVYH